MTKRNLLFTILLLTLTLAAGTEAIRRFAYAAPVDSGKVVGGFERRLYVCDSKGVSVYDINDQHKLLRQIEIPDSGSYKGIAASVQLNRLYISSSVKDELLCLDLATEKIVWRKQYGK